MVPSSHSYQVSALVVAHRQAREQVDRHAFTLARRVTCSGGYRTETETDGATCSAALASRVSKVTRRTPYSAAMTR